MPRGELIIAMHCFKLGTFEGPSDTVPRDNSNIIVVTNWENITDSWETGKPMSVQRARNEQIQMFVP